MTAAIKSLNLHKERALIRLDLNVPIKDGQVADDFRIRSALPTVEYCLEAGASVIIMSHLGRPAGKIDESMSLMTVGESLCDYLETSIKFSHDCVSDDAVDVTLSLQPGEIHLLENLRFHEGETENDAHFSRRLAKHGTCFINDAFGTVHRSHASNVGVTQHIKNSVPGFLMENEFAFFHDALKKPKRPLTVVLGGAKVDTKLPLIKRFIREADHVIVGGGMVFTLLKASGISIGKSLFDKDLMDDSKKILELPVSYSADLLLPKDFRVTNEISSAIVTAVRSEGEIGDNEIGIDIGPASETEFSSVIAKSETIIWNGPMGIFEIDSFGDGTKRVAQAIAEVSHRGGTSIIGGGDSAAAVTKLNLQKEMTHISTGGGASLELLAGKKLPALKALKMM
ncbi:MAG: phosphoglycerate kinase [Candidatus Marinimicrobia bacterium]|nr:phosphoglycerate kinase [Candidatus Neomarinimicrobiota bacterium]|tara:strand:- start:1608 stop:2798 length:1191 start_codon:yes stop_codon:yes gene_type:complete